MSDELFSAEQAPVPEVLFEDMLACVDRELKMRRRVYPNWVQQKKLTQAAADEEMRRMRGVRTTLIRATALVVAIKRFHDRGAWPAPGFWAEVADAEAQMLKQYPPA